MQSMLSSAPQIRDPGIFVGTLSLWDSTTHETGQPLEIYSNDEVFIGRDARRWYHRLRLFLTFSKLTLSYFLFSQFHISNPFVSNKHIRIYTILFDQDNLQEIPPLVYAQDLSMNGTFWNDYRMGTGKGSYLLSDGDILRVAVGVHIQFKSADPDNENKFTQLQQLEMRVCVS
jgi:protein-serine/threonine kinase